MTNLQIKDLLPNPDPALTDQTAVDNAAGVSYKTTEEQRLGLFINELNDVYFQIANNFSEIPHQLSSIKAVLNNEGIANSVAIVSTDEDYHLTNNMPTHVFATLNDANKYIFLPDLKYDTAVTPIAPGQVCWFINEGLSHPFGVKDYQDNVIVAVINPGEICAVIVEEPGDDIDPSTFKNISVQAWSGVLQGFSALVGSGANKVPYFTGNEEFSYTDFTAVARTFVGQTSVPLQNNSLQNGVVVSTTVTGTYNFDVDTGDTFYTTMTGDTEFIAPALPASGNRREFYWILKQDVTGGHAPTYTDFTYATGAQPIFPTSGSSEHYLCAIGTEHGWVLYAVE